MADEGATPRELVLEACRRNNTDLLEEVISSVKPTAGGKTQEQAVAELLNNTRDAVGNAALHVAASAGSYETLDILLDQPGLETDPVDRLSSETPLHKAVHLCNSLPTTPTSAHDASASSTEDFLAANEGHSVVEILLDAGCDPRIRNQSKMKPVDIVDGRNERLRNFLRRAEMMLVEGEAVIEEDDDDEDSANEGPPSDSD